MSYDFTNIVLPEQWEQQYDVLSKRFYFVDHVNKVTTWVDPRIELYVKQQQEIELKSKSTGTTNAKVHASSTAPNTVIHDKKAKDIHSKYSKVALSRIKQLLDDNFDNVSSVESILQREVQLANDQETLKKAATVQKLKEEQEAKSKKEEKSKKGKENSKKTSDKEVKLKSGESSNSQSVPTDVTLNENSIFDIKKIGFAENDFNEDAKMKLSKENITEESRMRLNKGPDKSICSGPNPKNKMGPNRDLIKEKESLAKGANSANLVGSKGNFGIITT